MTPPGEEPPLRLLALDGGGSRGLSELLIIRRLMHRLMVEENAERKKDARSPLSNPPKPCEYFDLIGGTSTGGIIALMLGRLRMDIDTAIKYYDNLAEDVFSDPKKWGDGRFKATKLKEAVKSIVNDLTGDPESPLLESDEPGVCRTFVCSMNAHNMNANTPMFFRTYQSHETQDYKIWEAARATSAAPAFFKRIEIGRQQPFIDGGLGRNNNPSRLVLEEAKYLFGSRQIGLLLSIGTGMTKTISIPRPGIFQQAVPTNMIDALNAIATDCEATHDAMVDLFANFPNTYFRLNVDHGMQEIEFSEWEKLSKVETHTTQYINRKEVNAKLGMLVNVIRVPKGRISIDRLISPRPHVESSSSQHVKDHKLCPLPVTSFTGRDEILKKMHQYFNSEGEFQHVFVLYGLGGSGKSQLAFKFLEESQANKRFSDVFYIDTTNRQTLEMDLGAITPGDAKQSVDASLRWLASQSNGRWMLFFDNADDVDLNLKAFFPPCRSGNILITTRNRELRYYAAKGFDQNVLGMEHDDATKLLLHLSQAEETDENQTLAALIAKELHHFALAVSQAGAFIRCHSSLSHYRRLYQRERDKLLQHDGIQGQDPHRLAVYATWRLSYDKLDVPARSLLQICSMLHHEGISEEMFEKAALSPLRLEDSELQNEVTELLNQLGKRDSGWSSWDFLQVVKTLGSYSLIEYDARNCIYSLHPLVQHWSGTTMGKRRHVMRKCVLGIIGLSVSWTFKEEDFKYRRTLLNHMSISTASLNPTEIDPLIASRVALAYSEQGRWTDAEELEVVVVEKTKRLLGDDHPVTLSSMANLAGTYSKQGRWKDAEELEVVVVEKTKRLLGDDHPDTLSSMANLASGYRTQGRWKDAEELEMVAAEKRKWLLGDDHPDTLTSMANLASTYRNQGRWKDAEELDVVVVEKTKRLLGDDHPHTLISMANLASTYSKQGRWKDAEKLEVVVEERRKRLMGDDHPDTLSSMANLACTYRDQGRWKDAEELEVVAAEKRKRLLGDDHPDTLLSMANLASTYRNQGRWKDAEDLEVVVVEKTKRLLGDDHPHTLISMANLAVTYRNQGRWKDAEELEVVVVEKTKRLSGDDHPHTLISMANLAVTYRNQGRWTDAEELEMVVVEKTKRLLGDDHPHTLISMANLACTYSDQGRRKEAEELLVVVVEKRKRLLGDDHPDTLISMANLAVTYRNQGRGKDAEELEVVVMEKRKWLLGDDHPDTVSSMANLASTYRNQGRWKDAEEFLVVVVEQMKRLSGDDHPHTLINMANLASAYRNQGRWKDAEELEVVVVEKTKRLLGDDHPHTLISMANLASTYSNQSRWKDAEALEVVVMEKTKRLLGDDHLDTLSSMANLAITYRNQGRWKDAEELEVVVMEKTTLSQATQS